MRIESSVTTISWIPSEAVTGASKAAFATVGLQLHSVRGRGSLLEVPPG